MPWPLRSLAAVFQAEGHGRPCRVHLLGMAAKHLLESHLLASVLKHDVWNLSFHSCPLWVLAHPESAAGRLSWVPLHIFEPPGSHAGLELKTHSLETWDPSAASLSSLTCKFPTIFSRCSIRSITSWWLHLVLLALFSFSTCQSSTFLSCTQALIVDFLLTCRGLDHNPAHWKSTSFERPYKS